MDRRRQSFCLVFMLSFISASATSAGAWSNGGYSDDVSNPNYGTHDWIADMALSIQSRNATFLLTTHHAEFLLGTEAPDNRNYLSDFVNHHVYYYETGVVQDDVGAARAEDMYDLAFEHLESGDLSQSAFYAGAMTGYIADIGVFGHTMGTDTDWDAEAHHADYEEVVESMIGSLGPPSAITLCNKTPYDATLDLARDITFGTEIIRANIWMDVWYDWSNSSFETSAIASLHASIGAVASAVNYLLMKAEAIPPLGKEPSTPPEEEPLTPQEEGSQAPAVDEPLIRASGPAIAPPTFAAVAAMVALIATASVVVLLSRLADRGGKGPTM
jgi:hypothetical protein